MLLIKHQGYIIMLETEYSHTRNDTFIKGGIHNYNLSCTFLCFEIDGGQNGDGRFISC